MSKLGSVFLGSLLLSVALAFSPASAGEVDISRDLTAASRVRPTVRYEGGFPRFVQVDIGVEGADARARAFDYLARFGALYGLADPQGALVVDRITTDDAGLTHVFFLQQHEGHRVMGGQLAVHLSGRRVVATNGHLIGDLGPLPAAALDADRATRIALDATGFEEVFGRPTLVVEQISTRKGLESRLAWKVEVGGVSRSGPGQYAVSVDAADGAILRELARSVESMDLEVETAWNDTSGACWWFGGTTTFFTENGPTADYSPSDDAFDDALDLWNASFDLYDWWLSELGQKSYDDDNNIDEITHNGVDWNNASFVPGCGQMWFGDGWGQPDILAHEFAHAVDSHHQDLDYENESGALDESYADVFAALFDSDEPIMADTVEGFGTRCDGGKGIRDLSDPPDCDQPDQYKDRKKLAPGEDADCDKDTGNDCGFVHTNSGIPNKAAWLLMEGGFFNGFQIDPIGRYKVAHLYKDVLENLVTSDTNFADARDLTVMMAQIYQIGAVYGFTGHDVCQIKNAFASVGVAVNGGDSDCDGISNVVETDNDGDFVPDGSDNCKNVANGTQLDSDGDGTGNACDLDDDNDGVLDGPDNCDTTPNKDQKDADGDGKGDLCDDSDQDGVIDPKDNCPNDANSDQSDIDGDKKGDVCDPDTDGDGVYDDKDNCDHTKNWDQKDTDGDYVGDACDNCVDDWNTDQGDCDGDGKGDACDPMTLFEMLECHPIEIPRAINDWVHPLDLVSLPVCDGCTVLPEGARVWISARISDGTPVRIVDDQGNHVVTVGPEGASFEPRASAIHAVGREVTSFHRYFLEVGPSASGRDELELEVELSFDGK